MRTVPLPFTDATLEFGLPFPGLHLAIRLGALSLALLVILFLIFMLYRRELHLVSKRVLYLLLALRIGLVASLFLLLTMNPVLAHTVREQVPGRVLIAIDHSDSMTVTDPHRLLADKLKIGRLLKLTTDLASVNQHEAWERQAEAQGDVRFSPFAGAEEQARYLRVIAKLNDTPRLTVASRIVLPEGLRLIESLQTRHTVEVMGFDQDFVPLPADSTRLAESLARFERSPDGYSASDLKIPLNRAVETAQTQGATAGSKLLGVVLLTDGRHNWGESPVGRAVELGQLQIPIYPIVLAPDNPPADVAIVSAQAQASTVFKGSVVPVEASVRVTGWPAGPIEVTMTAPPKPDGTPQPPLKQSILHDGNDQTYPLSFQVKLDIPGPQTLTVAIEPAASDRFPENNQRSVRINVVKDRAKVMLIDGEARWEFHYIHTCLGRDPNMDIRSVVFRQPRIGAVKDDAELRSMGTPAIKLPEDADVLSSYDCIILGDVEPTQLTVDDRTRLEQYVAEAGGTLVMLAGKRAMPLYYMSLPDDPFQKLLPLKSAQITNPETGFPLTITQEGERSWFLALGNTREQSVQAWSQMPLHYWAITGAAKDAAEVLAAIPGKNPREQALIARQSYGFGRVLYVGIDSTWRWRYKTGDYYHHRFWGQVAQWAASDRLLPVTNASGSIRFGTREPIYTGGQAVDIVVRTSDTVKKLTPNAVKSARIVRRPREEGGVETPGAVVSLAHPDGRPRDLAGKAPELPPGKYMVELDVPEWADELVGPPGPDGRSSRLRCPFEVMPPDNEELVDLSANRAMLEELAQQSGGKVYDIATLEQLLEDLSSQSAIREYRYERPLRYSWWALGVFVSLLAAEWFVRKWAGLP